MISKQRVGTEIGLMTGRIKQTLLNGRDNVSNAKIAVAEKTRRAARRTDYYVHDNAWKMIGMIAGAAFVAGLLISRRKRSADSTLSRDSADQTLPLQKKSKGLNTWELIHSAIPLGLFFWKAAQATRCERKQSV